MNCITGIGMAALIIACGFAGYGITDTIPTENLVPQSVLENNYVRYNCPHGHNSISC